MKINHVNSPASPGLLMIALHDDLPPSDGCEDCKLLCCPGSGGCCCVVRDVEVGPVVHCADELVCKKKIHKLNIFLK